MAVIPNTKNSIDGGQVVARPVPKPAPTPAPDVKVTPVAPKPVVTTPAPATPAPATDSPGSIAQRLAAEAAAKKAADDKAAKDKADAKEAEDAAEAKRVLDAKRAAFAAKEAADEAKAKAGEAAELLAKAKTAKEAQEALDNLNKLKAEADAAEATRLATAKARQDAIDSAAALVAADKAIADAKTTEDTAVALAAYNKTKEDKDATFKANEDAVNVARVNATKVVVGTDKDTKDNPVVTAPVTGSTSVPVVTGSTTTYTDQFGTVRDLDPDFNQIPFDSLADNIKNVIIRNAALTGVTPEAYYAMRGGVNTSGYYGDAYGIHSVEGVSLSDEEYQEAIDGKSGVAAGVAVNAARAEKIKEVTGEDPAWLQQSINAAEKAGVEWPNKDDSGTKKKTYTDKFGNVKELDPEFNALGFDELPENIKKNIIDNAKLNNMTPEAYYAMRGGVNKSGYFGDAYGVNSQTGVSLTDEEYAAAVEGKSGPAAGAAVNAAQAEKVQEVTGKEAPGLQGSIDAAEEAGIPWTGPTPTTPVVPPENKTKVPPVVPPVVSPVDETNDPNYTKVDPLIVPPVVTPGGTTTVPGAKTSEELAREDAFEQIKSIFKSYGIEDLGEEVANYMKQGKGPNETVMLLKQSIPYNRRFNGNVQRAKAGLNVVSEAEYIALENSYSETLKAYGLTSMLTNDRKKNEILFASYIGADIAPTEFRQRIQLTVDRVQNADPAILSTLKSFYPTLNDSDLVSYFLNPADSLPRLQEKVTAGEIGAAALGQGLTTNESSAAGLAAYGVDRQAALQGYSNIATVLPESAKLGDIYSETGVTYNQQTGEQEFFKNSDAARRKRETLASKERASFAGSSGNASNALNTRPTSGQI